MHYLNTLLTFITLHPTVAYGTIFLISLFESLALVGLIVPGTVIMFGVGAIVATGSLGLIPVLLLAAAGAIAGDGISYWLGHHYQEELRKVWPFSRYPTMLQNGEAFFHRHGGKSVLFGRFFGPVRPVIPVVAGMLGMGPVHFSVVNVLSAMGWAFAYILPGLFFGTSLAVAGAVSTRLAILLLFILAISWGLLWLLRRLVILIEHSGPGRIAALKTWGVGDTHDRGVMQPVKRLVAYLFRRQHGDEVFFGALVLAFFLAGWGFLGVLQDVLAKDPLVLADQSVYQLFESLRTPWGDRIFVALTELGDSFVNICLSCLILLVLLAKRCYRTAGFWVVAALGGIAGVLLLKWMIHLPRPAALYHGASAYGFPSGHTTMSVILYGFLAIILVRDLSSTRRWGIVSAAMLLAFIIAISRLYLGAHWLSDVLGGFFIGICWTALLGIAYFKSPHERLPRRWLGVVTALVVVVAGGYHVAQRHEKDLMFYAPQQHVRSMLYETWITDGWRTLPVWQIDIVGEREQPLTIQWAGNPAELAQSLAAWGWQIPPALNLKNFLGMLSPDTPIENLPVLPRLHNGRVDHLRLARRNENNRWVLRLWRSDFVIAGKNIPLFIGTIEVQRRRHLTWLITTAADTGEYNRPQAALIQMIRDQFALKPVRRTVNEIQVDHANSRFYWQGQVLLVWRSAELE